MFFVGASVPVRLASLINFPCKLKKTSESANSYHNNSMFLLAFLHMGIHGVQWVLMGENLPIILIEGSPCSGKSTLTGTITLKEVL